MTVKGATIHDVARAAAVSVATVSRTLNGIEKVAASTRERVLKVAGELDYVPHSGARALTTRKTDTIGVLLPELHGEFFSELIRGIDVGARESGMHLLLSHSHGDPEEAAAALRAMRSRVDAMLVMSPHADRNVLKAMGKTAKPMVVLGSGDGADGHPSFLIDNYSGAYDVTAHLIGQGYRRIAFISGPDDNIDAGERLRGYRAALSCAEAGVVEQVVPGDFSEGGGYRAARRLIEKGAPEAIFAANDMTAIGCVQALREAGLKVPDDVAVAGFDDIPVARYLDPALTTVAVPIAEIGRQALQCCLDLLAGKATQPCRTFKPELVIRASSGAPSANRQHGRIIGEDLENGHSIRID